MHSSVLGADDDSVFKKKPTFLRYMAEIEFYHDATEKQCKAEEQISALLWD